MRENVLLFLLLHSIAAQAAPALPTSLYFRQLRPGDEIATSASPVHALSRQMNNFVYVVGDRETQEAVLIDASWDLEGILSAVAADQMNVTRAFATHYHWDHIGKREEGEKEKGRQGAARAGTRFCQGCCAGIRCRPPAFRRAV